MNALFFILVFNQKLLGDSMLSIQSHNGIGIQQINQTDCISSNHSTHKYASGCLVDMKRIVSFSSFYSVIECETLKFFQQWKMATQGDAWVNVPLSVFGKPDSTITVDAATPEVDRVFEIVRWYAPRTFDYEPTCTQCVSESARSHTEKSRACDTGEGIIFSYDSRCVGDVADRVSRFQKRSEFHKMVSIFCCESDCESRRTIRRIFNTAVGKNKSHPVSAFWCDFIKSLVVDFTIRLSAAFHRDVISFRNVAYGRRRYAHKASNLFSAQTTKAMFDYEFLGLDGNVCRGYSKAPKNLGRGCCRQPGLLTGDSSVGSSSKSSKDDLFLFGGYFLPHKVYSTQLHNRLQA